MTSVLVAVVVVLCVAVVGLWMRAVDAESQLDASREVHETTKGRLWAVTDERDQLREQLQKERNRSRAVEVIMNTDDWTVTTASPES